MAAEPPIRPRTGPGPTPSRATGLAVEPRRIGYNLEVLEDRCLLSFSPVVSFPVGTGPQAVVTADFNNDGSLDLATANSGGNTVSVLLGDGLGGFGAASHFATGTGPRSMAVGDFNNDGNLDVATVNAAAASSVSVLLGNGDGAFQPPVNTRAIEGWPKSVAAADFNADGNTDLVYTYRRHI